MEAGEGGGVKEEGEEEGVEEEWEVHCLGVWLRGFWLE